MSLLSIQKLDHRVESKVLFKDLSLTIDRGEHCALIGPNGTGKSTLLKIVAGLVLPDGGSIARQRGMTVEYVPQHLPKELAGVSLFDAIGERASGGYADSSVSYLIEQHLEEAGFSTDQFHRRLGELSGGQVTRALFARSQFGNPDLILLDEPTNHLDIEGIGNFEQKLLGMTDTALIIVSHDRRLLDSITKRTLFLRDNRLLEFDLAYSSARRALESMDEDARARRANEDREIERLQTTAIQLNEWCKRSGNEKFSRRAKSIEKRIVRRENERTFVSKSKSGSVTLTSKNTESPILVRAENLKVSTQDDRILFTFEQFEIRQGERIALVGKNGSGKSTFLKQLVSSWRAQSKDCRLRFNPNIRLGYYDQELKHLSESEKIGEAVENRCEVAKTRITAELVRAGFPYERHHDRVSRLSGGEKARLSFLILHLLKPNLLVLDEPTNHLDVAGIEELEEQLVAGGTCLFVSHDREFVERVAGRIINIG